MNDNNISKLTKAQELANYSATMNNQNIRNSINDFTEEEQSEILSRLQYIVLKQYSGMSSSRNTNEQIKHMAQNWLYQTYGCYDATFDVSTDNSQINITLVRPRNYEEILEDERHKQAMEELEKQWEIDKKTNAKEEYEWWLNWFQFKYGEEIGSFLAKRTSKLIRDTNDKCIDNHRVTEVGNQIEEQLYKEQLKQGCCGFVDEVIEHYKSGRIFRLGFNYGH